jgi:hypothetical protein
MGVHNIRLFFSLAKGNLSFSFLVAINLPRVFLRQAEFYGLAN